ncbi:hypothetical protein MATL_G00218960 [Megalops atlanticus]|uniref:Protein FAM104A-like n=1 Tax=Megalops atlanticus TaxID=7932 RepID=A0A9D3PHA6_MEGAT|nr:hypothetical protein MATL_G00218960 [Megalops atlanticus]
MLTENRKRRRSCSHDDSELLPQAKRSGGGQTLFSELGRDVWDSESSSSDSSVVSSPEGAVASSSQSAVDSRGGHCAGGSCSPVSSAHLAESAPVSLGHYHHINRILREAHFHSVQSRAQSTDT